MGDDEPGGLVLVVEDEPAIADVQRLYLTRAGFGVMVVVDGLDGLAAIMRHRPVAVVLDVGLPGLDGIEVCRRLRASDDWTPVLFVTARDDDVDRILGLELGADDYVTKPFNARELAARVRGVVRRAAGPPRRASRAAEVDLDPGTREVRARGRPVHLTATEFDLLAALVARPGQVLSREQLMSRVWGAADFSGSRTVDVHVAQVRAKLGSSSPIRTVRGVGYVADP